MAQLVIDVSEHNGEVNWQKVKEAGYHAIIRVGFGRFDSGGRLDSQWARNVAECERLSIPWGAYWYSYATRTESARVEARQCIEALEGHAPSYPVYFDTEEPGTQDVSHDNAVAFCEVIEAAGYWAGIYASESWWGTYLGDLAGRYTSWVANWSGRSSIDADLWQYTDAGEVPGVGKADVSELLRATLLKEIAAGSASPGAASDVAARPLTYQQRAAEVMLHMVSHDGDGGHGYSQAARWGDGTCETVTLSDGSQVCVPNGDYDCSSAVITAWERALPGSTGGATYTGDMRACFLATGLWEWHPMGDGYIAQTGDVYLNEASHTAMCKQADPDEMMQFSISETGGISGEQGDQTGWESSTKRYADYPWDGKLVYVGPQPDGAGQTQTPQQPSVSQPEADAGERIDEDGWWGSATTLKAQRHYGTTADGEVSHQWAANVEANPALTSGWQCDATQIGSDLIRALQRDLGVAVDGIFGPDTIRAMQARCGTAQDGELWAESPCVKAFQHALNEGTW